MEFGDIEITPDNYSYPIRPRIQDIYFTLGKKFFKEIYFFLSNSKYCNRFRYLSFEITQRRRTTIKISYNETNEEYFRK